MKSFAFSAFSSPAPAESYKTVFLSMLELSVGVRLWEQGLLKMLKTCLIYVKIKLPDFCVCVQKCLKYLVSLNKRNPLEYGVLPPLITFSSISRVLPYLPSWLSNCKAEVFDILYGETGCISSIQGRWQWQRVGGNKSWLLALFPQLWTVWTFRFRECDFSSFILESFSWIKPIVP